MFHIVSYIKVFLIVAQIVASVLLIMSVLLQRGEDGAFARLGKQNAKMDNGSLWKITIIFACLFFGIIILQNYLTFHTEKKHTQLSNQIATINKK